MQGDDSSEPPSERMEGQFMLGKNLRVHKIFRPIFKKN